jgi:DNA-binding transcriptional MerR regulator
MSDFLSLTEASRRADVSPTSVRRWIAAGKLKASKNKNDEWVIDPDILHHFLIRQVGPRVGPTSENTGGGRRGGATAGGPTVGPSVGQTVGGGDGYAEALKEAREALARERQINDELRTQVRELEKERTQHLAEMRAMLAKDGSGGREGMISRWIRR